MNWRSEIEGAVVERVTAVDVGGVFRSVVALSGYAEIADVLGRALASVPFALVKYEDATGVQGGGGAHEVVARFSVTVGGSNFRGEDERRMTMYGLLDLVQEALVGWAPKAWTGELSFQGEEAVGAEASGLEIWVQDYSVRVVLDRG